jgi:hypothetical protein
MFTEAERAEIGAELRRLRAEGKGRIHVIPSKGGWRVFRQDTRGGKRSFRDKDKAIAYGKELAALFQKDLVVHLKDGYESWEWEDLSGRAKVHGSSGL